MPMRNIRNKNHPPNTDLVQNYLESSWDIVTDIYRSLDLLTALAEAVENGELDNFLTAADIDTLTELNAYFTDGTVLGTASDFATAAQGAKVDFLTVTQDVDLDVLESRVNELDAAVTLQGAWDASAGTFPGGGTAQAGHSWIVSVGGTVDGEEFTVNDRIVALVDNAPTGTYANNWLKLDYTDQVLSVAGLVGAITASALRTALNVEDGATADQTDVEIETAYNNQVAIVPQAEAEAGTATTPRRWTAERVAQAIAALGGSGGSGLTGVYTATNYTANPGDVVMVNAPVTITLPGSPSAGDFIWILDYSNAATAGSPIVIGRNGNNIDGAANDDAILSAGLWRCYAWDASNSTWRGHGNTAHPDGGGGGGGLTPVFISDNYTASAGELVYCDSSVKMIEVTLPAGTNLDNIMVVDDGHSASTNPITITPNGAETIDDDTSFVIDQNEGWCNAAYDSANTNWRIAVSGSPAVINVNDFVTGFSAINTQTGTTYTFTEADLVQCVYANNAAASTYNIPDGLAADGETLNLLNIGAGLVTITVAGTDTLDSAANTCPEGDAITIICSGGSSWRVIGGTA